MNCVELKTRELTVVIGNNEAGEGKWASHRAGYNGIWSLSSMDHPENCFVPYYAGLNLEHFMDDLFMTDESEDDYEPRHVPMLLTQLSEFSVKLTQEPTPVTGVETEMLFELVEPHVIDMHFKARLHRAPRSGRWLGFFWASYINTPSLPAIHFRDGKGMLCGLCPDRHGYGGANTVCHESVSSPSLGRQGEPYKENSLAHAFSSRRFGSPVMFGYPGTGKMLLLQMFDQSKPVRLTMSPTGGGANHEKMAYNPAWDFQYIIDEAVPGAEYHLQTRVIYKPFTDIREIDRLYAEWIETGMEAHREG